MRPISAEILKNFDAIIEKKSVASNLRQDYRKWLRYFLDFREKYESGKSQSDQVRLFIEKITSKGWSRHQQHQATHASIIISICVYPVFLRPN